MTTTREADDSAATDCGRRKTPDDNRKSTDVTKPFNIRDQCNVAVVNKDEPTFPVRTRIAPVRLLGQGPYVIKSHPRPILSRPGDGSQIMDYAEWRQAVMRRNLVDSSKYDSFANTRAKPLTMATAEPYDITKPWSRQPRPPLLKPTKLLPGYETTPMSKMLHKRSSQPNTLVQNESSDEMSIGIAQENKRESRDVTLERRTTGGLQDNVSLANVALPSISQKQSKKS